MTEHGGPGRNTEEHGSHSDVGENQEVHLREAEGLEKIKEGGVERSGMTGQRHARNGLKIK